MEINEVVILEFNYSDWKCLEVKEYGYHNGEEYITFTDGYTETKQCFQNKITQEIKYASDFFQIAFANSNYNYDKKLLTQLNYPIKKIQMFLTKKYNDPKLVIRQM